MPPFLRKRLAPSETSVGNLYASNTFCSAKVDASSSRLASISEKARSIRYKLEPDSALPSSGRHSFCDAAYRPIQRSWTTDKNRSSLNLELLPSAERFLGLGRALTFRNVSCMIWFY